MSKRIRVIRSIFEPPLLETNEASCIEFYDEDGSMEALLSRVLDDNFWCLSTKKDADWPQTMMRHGYREMGHLPLKEILRNV